MRRLLRIVRNVFLILLLLAGCAAALPGVAYLYGASRLPEGRAPADPEPIPEVAFSLLWAKLGGHGPDPLMFRLNPYSYISTFAMPGMLVAYAAGKRLLPVEVTGAEPNAYTPAAAAVWVSRHWTKEQALATTLERSDYGHGFVGLRAAARGYFGEEPGALDAERLAMLLAALDYPNGVGPWCDRAENFSRARGLLQRARIDVELMVPEALPPPDAACP